MNMKSLYTKEQIETAFRQYQKSAKLHPLTCGGGGGPCSGVPLVLAQWNLQGVVLLCPECGKNQVIWHDEPLFKMVLACEHTTSTEPPEPFETLEIPWDSKSP